MNKIYGDCLATGIHDGYILAALLVTFGAVLALAIWARLDRRQLIRAVQAQQAAAQRAAAQENKRWL
ncbi:MAG: heme exporter protein CcmD [Gammaproteobacteria bacterium]|nr:heme exporter protein CcmD [Gammaproteobacteria bacterium]